MLRKGVELTLCFTLFSCEIYHIEVIFSCMVDENELLEKIKRLVISGKYRIKIHAVHHMIEEGFNEANITEAFTSKARIIENYPDDYRCLILGSFRFAGDTTSPLHIVCDYPRADLVDIVTAYIPQKPWWISPGKRGKIL